LPVIWIVSNQIIRLPLLKIETSEIGGNIRAQVSHPDSGAENIDHNLFCREVGRKSGTLGRKTDGMMDLSSIGDEHHWDLAIPGIGSAA
jgi:hypothetical protein